ncbi:MAG: ABC transporter substrate-binding protein [Chloroflexota bacterium]
MSMRGLRGFSGKRVSRRDAIRTVAGATVAGLALSALPASAAHAATVLTGPVSAVANQGASVTMALSAEPNTFDPHLTVGRNTQILLANVFDGLTARDGSGNTVAALAEDWGVFDDHTTWQFKLREGVTFHNGDPFTAESVKFTVERVINPDLKSTISSEMGNIAGADIIDPTTVHIRTKTPDIMLPNRFGELYGGMLSPSHTMASDPATLATQPNGTGPYMLAEWVKNERLVLQAFPNYWRGPANVSQITVRPILEEAARVAALQTGEVDIIANVPYERIPELEADPNLVVKTVSTPRVFFIGIDPRVEPLNDVRVRQALNYAVDVQSIISALYLGHATQLATCFPTAAFGYDPSVAPYPYDPEKAKALLAEAGYPNGFSVEFDSFTGSIADHSRPAEAIAEYLRQVGIDVKLNVFEFGAFGPRRVANQVSPLHIYSIGNAYAETAWIVKWMQQQGLGLFYRNEEIYALANQAEATFDPSARLPIYSEIQHKLKDDAGFIFLFQNDAVFAMNKKISYDPRADETQWLYPMTSV